MNNEHILLCIYSLNSTLIFNVYLKDMTVVALTQIGPDLRIPLSLYASLPSLDVNVSSC